MSIDQDILADSYVDPAQMEQELERIYRERAERRGLVVSYQIEEDVQNRKAAAGWHKDLTPEQKQEIYEREQQQEAEDKKAREQNGATAVEYGVSATSTSSEYQKDSQFGRDMPVADISLAPPPDHPGAEVVTGERPPIDLCACKSDGNTLPVAGDKEIAAGQDAAINTPGKGPMQLQSQHATEIASAPLPGGNTGRGATMNL